MASKGNKDIVKAGKATQFKPGKSGNPKGRPKDVMTKIAKLDTRYSKSDVRNTIAAIAGMTEQETKAIIKNKKSTRIEVIVAGAFNKAADNGSWKTIERMVELFADKAKSHIEHSIDKSLAFSDSELARTFGPPVVAKKKVVKTTTKTVVKKKAPAKRSTPRKRKVTKK